MPKTRTGATSITESSDLDKPCAKTNMAAKEDEPTLQAIFNMVKNTNTTVNTMEIRLKCLEEEGTPEIKKLSDQIEALTTSVNTYTDQIGELETTVKNQKVTIKKLTDKIDSLETQNRAHNLIIEGIAESANENVRSKIDNLFEDLELDFGTDCCDLIYRKGPKKQTTQRPRPIFVSFPYMRLKHKVLRNAYKLKEIEECKYTYLSDDLSQEQQSKRRDLRCLNAYAKSMNIDSKYKGDAIVVDGVRYTHVDIGTLPHDITLEHAKVVKVQDGYAFQSEHAFLSSLYHCDFTFKNQKYHSSEQALHHVRADENNQPELASQILETKTSREAMDYSLAQRHLINKASVRGGNKLGLSLENIRDKFIEDDSKAD